jgi:hypothetical protein
MHSLYFCSCLPSECRSIISIPFYSISIQRTFRVVGLKKKIKNKKNKNEWGRNVRWKFSLYVTYMRTSNAKVKGKNDCNIPQTRVVLKYAGIFLSRQHVRHENFLSSFFALSIFAKQSQFSIVLLTSKWIQRSVSFRYYFYSNQQRFVVQKQNSTVLNYPFDLTDNKITAWNVYVQYVASIL